MPLTFSKGGMHMLLHPQDVLRKLQHKDKEGIWCMLRKCSKDRDCLDAVRQLEGDVIELTIHNMDISGGTFACADTKQYELLCQHLSEDVHKHLQTILGLIKFLTGDASEKQSGRKHMPSSDAVELLEQLIAADLPVQLLEQLPLLAFETRKDIMNVCCALLWSGMPQQFDKHVVEYLRDHSRVWQLLVEGYANEEVALHYGVVLRSCARHKELVRAFFESGQVMELLKYAQHRSMDISSDAFYSLRSMLLEHREVSAAWLSSNFDEFFRLYNKLLKSGEYLAERQAQKLLAEILLDRHFRNAMLAYVNNDRNLQIHMVLLKDSSKVIQVEAFHVFKIFAANPQKPQRVQQILYKNRDKLVALLQMLPAARPDDKKFAEETRGVLERLRHLEAPTPTPRKDSSDPAVDKALREDANEYAIASSAGSEYAHSEGSTTASIPLSL